jgi:tmRNA-binding protein
LRPRLEEKGLTLVPLSMYFKRPGEGQFGLGRASCDKRHATAKRDSDLRIRREMGRH